MNERSNTGPGASASAQMRQRAGAEPRDPKTSDASARRQTLWALCGVLFAVSALLISARDAMCQKPGGEAKSGGPEGNAPEVAVWRVQPRRVELTTELPGRISAYLVADIRPQISGLLQKRLFTEGSDVQTSQVLYEIDSASFQAAYDNAQANLAVAQESTSRARAALEASLANVARQKAALDLAQTNRKRYEEMFESKAISPIERDVAVTEAVAAEATLRAAEAQVESDRKAITVAQAGIKQAEAALEIARINLGYTRITAPISGRIGRSNVTVGALVSAYQPLALATIQQLNPIYVDVPQSTSELLALRRRIESERLSHGGSDVSKVRLILEDGTPYPQEGTLEFRDVTVDQSTGSVIMRMAFPNPEAILLPGMFVRAVVPEGVKDQAIMVPQQGVARDSKGNPYALVVNAEGKIESRQLTLDRALGDKWLVVSGLAAGDQVVVEGMQKARPGSAVKVVPWAAQDGAKDDKAPGKPSTQQQERKDGGA